MRKFDFKCRKLKIAGADVELRRLTPAIFPDVVAIIDKFNDMKDSEDQDREKMQPKDIMGLILDMPEHKRCALALTDLTEEEYNAMPFDVLFDLTLEVTKENADFFSKALSKWTEPAKQTGQS